MRINSNSGALALQHNLSRNVQSFDQATQRLSTGIKLNAGKDGPAALISSEQLRSVLASLEAESNILQRQDHYASTADAALAEVSSVLVDTKALQVQAADSTRSDAERAAIQLQIDSNVQSVDRMAAAAGFNGSQFFTGDVSLAYEGQTLDLPRVDSASLGETEIDGTDYTLADVASGGALVGNVAAGSQVVDAALSQVATLRGQIGAYQANTLQTGMNSNRVAMENTAAATSAIRDTDFAAEAVEMRRAAILTQANIQVFASVTTTGARALDLLA